MLKGVRFRKGLSLAKGVRLNICKSGVSLSLGKPGMSYNIGTKGTKATLGLPGSGVSYSSQDSYKQSLTNGEPRWTAQRVFRWIILAAVVVYVVMQVLA